MGTAEATDADPSASVPAAPLVIEIDPAHPERTRVTVRGVVVGRILRLKLDATRLCARISVELGPVDASGDTERANDLLATAGVTDVEWLGLDIGSTR